MHSYANDTAAAIPPDSELCGGLHGISYSPVNKCVLILPEQDRPGAFVFLLSIVCGLDTKISFAVCKEQLVTKHRQLSNVSQAAFLKSYWPFSQARVWRVHRWGRHAGVGHGG
jgi:hypothetical protein